MSSRRLLLPLAVGLALRLAGVGWDGFTHQHPDERFLVMVAGELAFPSSWGEALDPYRTPLNPQNRGFSFFVYGSLFPTLNLALAKLTGLFHYRGLLLTGRLLSAFFDSLTLLLLVLATQRLAGPSTALWVGWLYAFSGLAIQHARFGTPDALALTCVSFTLLASFRKVTLTSALGAGLGVGLAAATRPNLVTLVLPVSLALLLFPLRQDNRNGWFFRGLALGVAGLTALVVWKLADPGFFASILSPWPNPQRLASLREVAFQIAGYGQFPPNLQWVGRNPVFLFWNFFFWGLGPALGVAILLACLRGCRRLGLKDPRLWTLILWPLILFGCQCRGLVVSVRHALPALPFLLAFLALIAHRWRWYWRQAVLFATLPWGLAWAAIPWQPYTRKEASHYLRQAVSPGAVIAVEAWDDPLPIGEGLPQFSYLEIPAYEPDTAAKRKKLLDILARAQVIVLSSQRAVGSICRVPDAYPIMAEFYHLLFQGELGFRLAFFQEVKLGWGRSGLSMLGAEEALSVYDHPPVWIFAKEPTYDQKKAEALLLRVPPPGRNSWNTRDLEARGLPPYLSRWGPLLPSPPSWPKNFSGQVLSLTLWLLFFELVGFAGAVLLVRLSLPREVATLLGRPLGSLLLGLGVLWLGTLGVPGWRAALPFVALVVALLFSSRFWDELLFSREAAFARWVFLVPLGIFLLVRAFNPEIYWGEKPMDAAIFQILLRSSSLPPQDPWFAGYPINYYFFGFLLPVTAAAASFAPAGVAFNLAGATIPALASLASAAGGWTLSRCRLGAVGAAFLTHGVGTAYLLFHPSHLAFPDFDHFWASSRVIANTINEYPVWTALFADLHAHFLSFPGFCTAVALLLASLTQEKLPRVFPWVLGAVLAAQFMSNSWELPALLLLTFGAIVFRFYGKTHSWAHSLAWLATAGLATVLASLPHLLTQFFPRVSIAWERTNPPALAELLALYGIHLSVFALAFALALPRLSHRQRSFVALIGGVILALIFGPQYVTIADKMNTYFKLGLQAFLLLGTLAGGLLARGLATTLTKRLRIAFGLVAVLVAAGLTQSLWGGWAVIHTRRVPGPRPTLDGEAYLTVLQPELAEVLPFLRQFPARTVGEPFTPPYSDTLRLPMFTGLPAVVGWEYHLWQRGKSLAEIQLRARDLDRLLTEPQDLMASSLGRRWRLDVLARLDQEPPPLPGFLPLGKTKVLLRQEP